MSEALGVIAYTLGAVLVILLACCFVAGLAVVFRGLALYVIGLLS